VTPQGWLRTWDNQGRVQPSRWEDASQILRDAGAAIISLEDVAEDENTIEEMAAHCPIFLVTEGLYGARVYWHGDVRRFTAPSVTEVNATGAGDIFAAAFFTRYHKTRDPWESARFANQLAAKSVTRSGLASVPTRIEVKNAITEVL
jgi:sugar/nucleoside kinase (ribokinase family)